MESRYVFLRCLTFMAVIVIVCGDYVAYTKTKDNKYEPVLKPVSSTVLPISLSELGSKRYSSADDDEGYDKKTLLTAWNVHKEHKAKKYDEAKNFVKIEPLF